MYERLHRIFMRMREEECTCQVFAAVAIDALCRSFETAVEHKQGISQLELLYAELAREEQQKQIRKEQKKLKRKRKKEKIAGQESKERCNDCETESQENDSEKGCSCGKEDLNCQNCENKNSNECGKCTDEKKGKKDKLMSGDESWTNDCR